ncbi:Elks/rab6-interacting/cast family member 1 [Plakobranchus ocellatus]|uniref:Elks/rab6-interacting/cast family member 1 n=1 Tax=Plakobranchus ocellatus TaxID=259542 RepID=A0AAV4C8E8_9GAST|nr:Elks/rab6-interacting/cast family member 1 [Plakobranchus ocellatus]
MNSIKTFWSPELKKERAVRKEEAARCNLLNEQLKVTQAELKKHREILRGMGDGAEIMPSTFADATKLQQEKDLQGREMIIMKKTIEELEIRIESQKQTLSARDESIKKLLEMLHSKGVNVTKIEEDCQQLEMMTERLKMEEHRRKQLEEELAKRDLTVKELTQIQALKDKVDKKDADLASLRLKVETKERQQSEKEGHISVLKDKVSSKERQATMLQTELEGLQERIKTKEDMIDRKNKELTAVQAEKRRSELEVMELKDQLEIKTNRICNLQRKIEGLEDTIREKEDQLSQARIRLTSTFTESPSDSTLSALEATLADKDKQIEKLKEQRDSSEKEHQAELDLYTKKAQDLKVNLDQLQKELTSKQTEVGFLCLGISISYALYLYFLVFCLFINSSSSFPTTSKLVIAFAKWSVSVRSSSGFCMEASMSRSSYKVLLMSNRIARHALLFKAPVYSSCQIDFPTVSSV